MTKHYLQNNTYVGGVPRVWWPVSLFCSVLISAFVLSISEFKTVIGFVFLSTMFCFWIAGIVLTSSRKRWLMRLQQQFYGINPFFRFVGFVLFAVLAFFVVVVLPL